MAYANQTNPHRFARVFLYGKGKAKKTLWSLKPAEAGYNILLLDSDQGSSIVHQIQDSAKSRIFICDCWDSTDEPIAVETLVYLIKKKRLFWDENQRTYSRDQISGDGIYQFDLRKPDPSLILVVDSWSAICRSLTLQYAKKNNIKLELAEKTDWDGYGWEGRLASVIIGWLKALPCHVIVVGHETTYEKYRNKLSGGRRVQDIVFSRRQPRSTSNPHGMTLAKEFDEILLFEKLKSGTVKIDTDGSETKDAGSRTFPPGLYDWDEFQFTNIAGPATLSPPRSWNTKKEQKPEQQKETKQPTPTTSLLSKLRQANG